MSQYTDDQLKAAFAKMDADGSGAIDRKEIVNVLKSIGVKEPDCNKMAGDVMKDDPNGDGKITLKEFMAVMKK